MLSSSASQGLVKLLPNGDRAPEQRYFQYRLNSEGEGNDFNVQCHHSMSGLLTTAVDLCTHAGLRQQQIGELDEHGNINLTNRSLVFTGKQSSYHI